MRNWAIAHAAAGSRGFDLIGYAALPEVYVGCAFAEWRLAGAWADRESPADQGGKKAGTDAITRSHQVRS